MTRTLQALLLLAFGMTVTYVALTGAHLNYVKPSLGPFLLASGVILIILGLLSLREAALARLGSAQGRSSQSGSAQGRSAQSRSAQSRSAQGQSAHEHQHTHGGPVAAWALTLPIAVALLLPATPLGTFTATRAEAYVPPATSDLFPPLVGDPADLSMNDFVERAVWDEGLTLTGSRVRLVGFVSPTAEGGWHLARLGISCCAADAYVLKVLAVDAPELPSGTWVQVVGRWQPSVDDALESIPSLLVESATPVEAPEHPYEG